jgi:hypothetical protein
MSKPKIMESFQYLIAFKWRKLNDLCDAIYEAYRTNGAIKFELRDAPVVYSINVPSGHKVFSGFPERIDFEVVVPPSKYAETRLPPLEAVRFKYNVPTAGGGYLDFDDPKTLNELDKLARNGKFPQRLKLRFKITSTHKTKESRVKKLREFAKNFNARIVHATSGTSKTGKEFSTGYFEISVGSLNLTRTI